jgi:predicted nucleic acid-binding Zn ribbon protein
MTEKRCTNKAFTPLAESLAKVLQQYRPISDPFMVQVWNVWQEAVGPSIAANARPVAFKADLLLVQVSSSTWLHHLRILEKEIIEKVNNALDRGRVGAIKWKVGTV